MTDKPNPFSNGKLCIHNIITGTEAKSRELNSDSKGIKVICTTVHKSKGLEYGVVILPNTDLELGKRMKNSIDITFDGDKIGYCLTDEKKNESIRQPIPQLATELKTW